MVKSIFLGIFLWLGALALLAPATMAQEPVSWPSKIVPGELVVKFRPQLGGQAVERALQDEGLLLLEASPQAGLLRVKVTPGREAETLARLQARPEIEFAAYNHYVQAAGAPNDPDYANQWGLNNTGQHGGNPGADIEAAKAWDIYSGGDNITIAIIDTGIDLDHPDLQASIVAGYDFVNDDADPNDDNGHGTHVAGIAAAIGNNGIGVAGVSWRAKMMPLKMLDAKGNGTTFDLAQAIYYAADHGAQIINMSLGSSCGDWPDVEDAINHALAKGVLLIAASGNGNTQLFCPAALAGVMAVGATTPSDSRWFGSNYGPELDVVAPGDFIYSTTNNGDYGYKTGTSMATPHVAGLAALLWSFAPKMTSQQVAEVIGQNSEDLGEPGRDIYYGQGRINARWTLEALSLQTAASKEIWVSDNIPLAYGVVQISTINPESITWTATISPPVSWLALTPPTSGAISSASPPIDVGLVATRPITYGIYPATVVVTGVNQSSLLISQSEATVNVIYVAQIYPIYVPLLLKN